MYLKDESCHPTGSLKHRLARSLFLYGLCNGWIGPTTTIVEASSGSTAISEAYFARLIGLSFVAVIPRGTSPDKIAQIEHYGGRCALVESHQVYGASERLARDLGGHFMDQFTYAERATDWRGNNNIAESIILQLQREAHPVPRAIVVSAGTGGTSATIGRYIRYKAERGTRPELVVVDPDCSVFFDYYQQRDPTLTNERCGLIEGIGRQRVEPSFVASVVDRMIKVPDAASLAAIRFLEDVLGRRCGGSTGTNLWGAFTVLGEMAERGERGSVVSLICDGGERYGQTYYSDAWLADRQIDIAPWRERLERFWEGGGIAALGSLPSVQC